MADLSNIRESDEDRCVNYEEMTEVSKKQHVLLIDVREFTEVEKTGAIPGSKIIPLGFIEMELAHSNEMEFLNKYECDKPNKETAMIFTCRSGRRAEIAMKQMATLGYKNCKYYPGSWLEWESRISSKK